MIAAEFFVQLIDASYLTILLVYMMKSGYLDYEAADFMGYRFLGVLLFSFPLGFYIKGRKIKPMFYFSAIATPICSVAAIYAIQLHIDILVYISLFLVGVSILSLQVSMIPYILRNVDDSKHTEAISLSYSTWSLGSIVSGILIFGLNYINPELFDEKLMLVIISVISLFGVFFLYRSKMKEFYIPILKRSRYDVKDQDWGMILKAMIPTLLIATGAGLAIPFMGIFFYKIHNIDAPEFALLSTITTILVFGLTIFVPAIKNKLGDKLTITGSQGMAVVCLLGLSYTEYAQGWEYAGIAAILFYVFRQPFMNIAAPMTSDLTMKYVGFRNREMVSALTAGVWSGCWFFSSKIFKVLRTNDVQYMHIFIVTAALYVVGIIWYYYLIIALDKREVVEV
jgi:hypothetical protein